MKKLFLVVVLVVTTNLFGGKFTVGVENIDYMPHYSGKNDYNGFAKDLLDQFAKDSGHTFEYKPMPLKRLFGAFMNGKVDLKYPDNAYWGADAKKGKGVVYSKEVVAFTDGVMVKGENLTKNKAQLKTLGTVMGFTPFEYLGDIKGGGIKVVENPSFGALLNQTIAGRIDGAYFNKDVAIFNLKKLGKDGALQFSKNLPHTNSHYHLSTIKHPSVVKEFNDWMVSNKDKVAAIKSKYNLK